jgi:hypothetical protein
MTPHGRLLIAIFAQLDDAGIRHAVLRNHELLPNAPRGDVDVVTDAPRAAGRLIGRVAQAHGYVRVRARRHTWHLIHRLVPGPLISGGSALVLDVQPGVTHRRGISIPAERALAGRRMERGIWLPAPGVEGAALLLHCALERRSLASQYEPRLRKLLSSASGEIAAVLGEAVGAEAAALAVRDPAAALAAIRRGFRGQPIRSLAARARGSAWYATARPVVLHTAPGVAVELARRGVPLVEGSRLSALRRGAAIVHEDGTVTIGDALARCAESYGRLPL